MAIFVRSSGGQLVEALTCKAVPCYELDDLGTQIEKWSRGCAMGELETCVHKGSSSKYRLTARHLIRSVL